MSYAKDLIEQFDSWISTVEMEAEYLKKRNSQLQHENEYLKNQIDVLLKVIGKEKNEDRD